MLRFTFIQIVLGLVFPGLFFDEDTPCEFPKESHWVLNQPIYDGENFRQVRYVPKDGWSHMNNDNGDGTIQTGSFPNNPRNGTDSLIYNFWGYGIEIYTEIASHHKGYIVTIDGEIKDTVSTFGTVPQFKQLTWTTDQLSHGNHEIVLTALGGYYVFDRFRILYSSDPDPCSDDPDKPDVPVVPDTIPIYDTIRVPVYDTIPYYADTTIVYDTIPVLNIKSKPVILIID